jgi:hypothetical protein
MFYQQDGYTLRFEWGYQGLQALLPVSDVISLSAAQWTLP